MLQVLATAQLEDELPVGERTASVWVLTAVEALPRGLPVLGAGVLAAEQVLLCWPPCSLSNLVPAVVEHKMLTRAGFRRVLASEQRAADWLAAARIVATAAKTYTRVLGLAPTLTRLSTP
jgi:hypothetical protein